MKVGRITALDNKPPDRMTAAELRKLTAKPEGANKLEAAFGEHLRLLHLDGIITEPKYHRVHDPKSLHLTLLESCGIEGTGARTYTPDWTFRMQQPLTITEIRQWNKRTGQPFIEPWVMIVADVKGTRYTPKRKQARAYYREDAFIDIRLAACLWPSWAFFLVYRVRGGWKWERVRGGKLGGEVDW